MSKKNLGAQIDTKMFVGKTISKLDIRAVNCVVFYFTDGTTAELEVEAVLPSMGLYGIVSAATAPTPIW